MFFYPTPTKRVQATTPSRRTWGFHNISAQRTQKPVHMVSTEALCRSPKAVLSSHGGYIVDITALPFGRAPRGPDKSGGQDNGRRRDTKRGPRLFIGRVFRSGAAGTVDQHRGTESWSFFRALKRKRQWPNALLPRVSRKPVKKNWGM